MYLYFRIYHSVCHLLALKVENQLGVWASRETSSGVGEVRGGVSFGRHGGAAVPGQPRLHAEARAEGVRSSSVFGGSLRGQQFGFADLVGDVCNFNET